MRMNMFVKTFLMLLISFSIVFLFSIYISYNRFGPMYVEENIDAVKESILQSSEELQNGGTLQDSELLQLSSETSFIRYQYGVVTETMGPDYLTEDTLVDFVVELLDNENSTQEGKLTYHSELIDDVYNINYIYEFEFGDWLIINTQIHSLTNVDRVLNNINIYQSTFMLVAIVALSIIISYTVSSPLNRLNKYAKEVSNLQFDSSVTLKRNDEFSDLASSLNEMTFNLRDTYQELNHLNSKLKEEMDFDKLQEEKKQHLIMTINHEIKTPLAVIKGMVEGMIDGVGRYKDKGKYLNEILLQIDVIEKITQDLNYRMKLEDKAVEGAVTSILVINDVLESLDELTKQKRVKISTNIEKAEIQMSEELLVILLQNIVKNAILYTEDKNVTITAKEVSGDYVVTVRNKAVIPEESLQNIFDSFYRVDTPKKDTNGSGLGLFIVKQICEIYGYTYKIFNDSGYVISKVILNIKK